MRVVLLVASLLLLVIAESFNQVAVSSHDGTTTYSFNYVAWIFIGAMSLMFIGLGEFCRRKMKDRWGAIILYSGVPLMGFLTLQLVYERVIINQNQFIHEREPPHTEVNISTTWEEIISAKKIRMEHQTLLLKHYFRTGYELTFENGSTHELPISDTLTAAQDDIDRHLKLHGISIELETIPLK